MIGSFAFLQTISREAYYLTMENFMTQFEMGGVKTTATIRIASKNEFDFALHLSDAFEGGELTPSENERDGTLIRTEDGSWELEAGSRVHLSEKDITSLGEAIEHDYLKAKTH